VNEPRSRTTDKRYYGVAEAIVTDVNDPDKEGRVKVRYPWFDDNTVSGWARVRQLYAGNGYGTYFVPEVGDEVLVAFVHGDMRLPVVLGGLYNGSDKPSVARNSSNDPKLIRTKGGHQILMDDTSGKEKVEITDAKGNVVVLDAAKNTITVQAQSDVTVESTTGKLALKGATVDIQATGAMTLKGSTISLN
jgi:phage baseplate assembly protein V